MEQVNLKNEEIIKIISDGTFDEVTQFISNINDLNNPLSYVYDDVSGRKRPIYVMDIVLLNSKDINVIKFILAKGAIYTTPFPYIISHCKITGIFTLLLQYPNVRNPLLKMMVKIISNFAPMPIFLVTAAMKNPNPQILKEVISNKKILKVLKNEKRKGTDLKKYFRSILAENTEEKYKIFEELNNNL